MALLAIYLIIINIITIAAYGLDKRAAIDHKFRIRESTLLGLAVIGGSVGALIGMHAFNHKVRKAYFAIGVPVILVIQIIALFLFVFHS